MSDKDEFKSSITGLIKVDSKPGFFCSNIEMRTLPVPRRRGRHTPALPLPSCVSKFPSNKSSALPRIHGYPLASTPSHLGVQSEAMRFAMA